MSGEWIMQEEGEELLPLEDMKSTTIITDSSSPYKDIFSSSDRIKIGFWYRQFNIINFTTLQIGKTCFWFTLKPYFKNFIKWTWGLLGTGSLLLFGAYICVFGYVCNVIDDMRR